MMNVGTVIRIVLAFALPLPGTASIAQSCQLCATAPADPAPSLRALSVTIDAALDFSTAVYTNRDSGSIAIEARTGRRQMIGFAALGGPALAGTVTITGEPFARVTVNLPRTVVLTSNLGGTADVTEIRTDLPPHPVIGPNGRLVFTFGGRLTARNGVDGDFRGRIPVTVDYN
ncbi:MAG: DUF4402 domain-containing protein [Sphingomonadales bacterium]|jgi:hypothetical protein|nr:DUF4402 domain-containing protein [Sphingomonadales bacterium]MBP7134815.1 DUF4402 domain-containing protein [Sphingomonadaceae bacterium]MBK6491226.1 DUF4402 domain-containing protein [Sphingomonadales bacterium]MBK6721136.1 DUF4402 domain-containing protein [Sphingomonadales bacterium]MBK7285506.1 DUF4402 domain-containing protein [Sphingomonadales bacterium]